MIVLDSYFQQDGAPCHRTTDALRLLQSKFGNRIISKSPNGFNTIEWPARSCDLTPLDYWLWSYLKNKISRLDKPKALAELEEAIIRQVNLIRFDVELLG